jgi:tRNA(Ile)-lysidine synthetase-like protein
LRRGWGAGPTESLYTDALEVLERIERHVRRHDLIEPGGEVLCLVSGGADSTCLFYALRELSYRVSALHVDHGLRGAESDADAAWCAERFGAEVVQGYGRRLDGAANERMRCATEAYLRDVRYSFRAGELRATGHTLSDQVETILLRLASRGTTKGIEVQREDRVVRPLLCVWREETEAFCRDRGLEWRTDSSNDATLRGLIRNEIIPLLERIHPAARENVLRVLDERRTMPPELAELLDSTAGSKRIDLGSGVQAVREHDRLWLEDGPRDLDRPVTWGGWRIESRVPGLRVRGWRPGDRLAGRSKKIQDVFVDAKVPRSDRAGWPLVVRGDEVVAVPGIVEAEGVTADRVAG